MHLSEYISYSLFILFKKISANFILENKIKVFMAYCRKYWPNKTISPKIHMLEDHVVDFIMEWKVGLGFYGEQGGESLHSAFNNLARTYSALVLSTRRLRSMLQSHYLKAYPSVQNLKPDIKLRGPYKKAKPLYITECIVSDKRTTLTKYIYIYAYI